MKNIADIYPLSPLQQGMLFHSLYAPDSGVYIVQMSYEIVGKIDKIAFAEAWQNLINRHSILRTAFVWEKLEKPLQVVKKIVKALVEYLDWQKLTISEQQQEFKNLLLNQRQQGFNLSKAPLMSLTLIQKTEDVYQFIWCYHHLLLDGWSLPLLIKEFLSLYQGENIKGQAYSYRDYIAWLQQQDLGKAERFWQENLKGFTTPNKIAQYKDTISSLYHEQEYQFSPPLTAEIQTFARRQQLTVNTIIQGAWALLLSCYSGENDIVFGGTVSGRPADLRGSQEMIGLFINTLPVRVKIPTQLSKLTWLKQLQNQQIERQQYEYTSLVDIQRVSDISRNLPLFESLVIFENYPLEPLLEQSFLEIRNVQTSEQTNFPLTLYAMINPQLTLRIAYEDNRFDSDEISLMLEHLECIILKLVREPEAKLSTISLLTEREQQIFREWNNTQTEYPRELCFHQLFEQQVNRTPNEMAVVFKDEKLTYRELNEKANQLAQYLNSHGVTSESIVGVYLEPSLEMIIALLGILKSGGVYLPLDPIYPQERLAFMLEDTGHPILITQQKFHNTLAKLAERTIYMDSDWEKIVNDNSLLPRVYSDNLAYIIYTSGSTGQPKGVQILHKALVNFLIAMQDRLKLTQQDTILAVTTLSFDIAALELFLPLILGAKVVLVSREVAADGIQLQEQLKTGITVIQATPATWRMLLESGWTGSENLKILCGGEALESRLGEQLLQWTPQVWNLYGPTETTIWSSTYLLKDSRGISLGHPIANTEFYILDKYLNHVPIGISGELYIGGEGLTRGYYKRPDLTAAKLIPHPFKPKERLYKTGDLVRYTLQGNLEYLSRIDAQVKLRGFRIELAEIESVLNQNPAIRAAAVVVREESLIAYVVTENLTTSDMRDFLAEKLPPYMIPSRFVLLDALPLTPNGKINRQALPTPEKVRPDLAVNYKIPQSETQRAIAQIWQQVLTVDNIGINDNFFELGGHSLLMVRIHSLLKEQFSTEMTLVDLFRYPTVKTLAEYLSQTKRETPSEESIQQELENGKQKLLQRRQQREMINKNR
ncbi:non-ribosomal peptide synthetase [Gloeocapsa sp. PCC 73106]|uniref:non-ribosomal peptide synthetase n=1 Tax=Gloeocapsa sp. PCC 73106 TaxID=102232 RepID=UPI0002AC7DA4|nr:non-ribosomal peptide synthetase [Gloeocapsa sp. PCC 73106]ELR97622.1 amino acid adenylation enzyme/thioester reductase family protein [Gloeocapsa sp. PCC 73106]